jgi:hypothetical protein
VEPEEEWARLSNRPVKTTDVNDLMTKLAVEYHADDASQQAAIEPANGAAASFTSEVSCFCRYIYRLKTILCI